MAGYSPLEAGLATTPVSLILFFLSPRWGKMASGTGPRLPMTIGPIVGGIGLLLLLRVGSNADYVTDVLPAILVFGLGLSATVAPLTATVLDSVEERHVGIASGVNNGIARVAGLLAIAVLGAVISAYFGSTLDNNLGDRPLGPRAERTVTDAKAQPLAVPKTGKLPPAQATRVSTASADASTSAFHLGIGIAGVLMIIGGTVSGFGIENPTPQSRSNPHPRLSPSRRVRPRRRRRLRSPSRLPNPLELGQGRCASRTGGYSKCRPLRAVHLDGPRGTLSRLLN